MLAMPAQYTPKAVTGGDVPKRTAGRPKGAFNKATLEAAFAAGRILDDPQYQKTLLERAQAGKLSPGVEAMLWAYKYGRPVERSIVQVDTLDDLHSMSIGQLKDRLKNLEAEIVEDDDEDPAA